MAVKKAAAAAANASAPATSPGFASLDPEQMGVGGLPSGFRARVSVSRFVPFNFKAKDGKGFTRRDGTVSSPNEHRLALMLILDPLPGELEHPLDPVIYSAGDLSKFVPSNDGTTPAGGSFEDYQALARGDVEEPINKPWDDQDLWGIGALPLTSGSKLTRTSNAGLLMEHAINGGLPADRVGATADLLDGIEATWVRVPQPERGGAAAGDTKQVRDILVPTDITTPALGAGAGTARAATKPASAAVAGAAPLAASNGSGDPEFASEVRMLIYEALGAAGDAGKLKSQLPPIMLNAFKADRAKLGAATKLVSSVEFLSAEESTALWAFDAATGKLSLPAA